MLRVSATKLRASASWESARKLDILTVTKREAEPPIHSAVVKRKNPLHSNLSVVKCTSATCVFAPGEIKRLLFENAASLVLLLFKFLVFFPQGRFGRSRWKTTLSSLRARRTPVGSPNCGEMHFFTWLKRPLTQKVIVGRQKLW